MNIDYNIKKFVEGISNLIQECQLPATVAKYVLMDVINQLNPIIDENIVAYQKQLEEQQQNKENETEQN